MWKLFYEADKREVEYLIDLLRLITVVMPDNLPTDIEVYSIAGTLIHSETTEGTKEVLLDNNYESGTYVIHVKNEKQHYIRKLVVN